LSPYHRSHRLEVVEYSLHARLLPNVTALVSSNPEG
jgi:hypothetical protein